MIISKLCVVRDILITMKNLVMTIGKFGRCLQHRSKFGLVLFGPDTSYDLYQN